MTAVVASTRLVPSPRASEESASNTATVFGAPPVLPELWVPAARQWVSTSPGRIATDGYTFMQAVHWVHGSGLYQPRRHRSHGPRAFNEGTVRVAQECARLSPCRPGVDYLARRCKLSERAVQYHLAMLRETGLLAYVVKPRLRRGQKPMASEFALMIPAEFDAALGVRTAGEGVQRRMVGIGETGRKVMATLAKKAARKIRKPRRKAGKQTAKPSSSTAAKASENSAGGASVTAVSAESRCTPMEGGAVGTSSAEISTRLPSENKLASGMPDHSTPKKQKNGGLRQLNRVGRRFQLARQLTEQIDWLRGCAVPRIAWVVKDVADADWTAQEVHALLDAVPAPEAGARRPSGLLASRLRGVTDLTGWNTPAGRAAAIEQMHRDQEVRHRADEAQRRKDIEGYRAKREQHEDGWMPPSSPAVQRLFADACRRAFGTSTGSQTPLVLEDLSREEIIDWRSRALHDHQVIFDHIDQYGETSARRLFTSALVDQARHLDRISHHTHLATV